MAGEVGKDPGGVADAGEGDRRAGGVRNGEAVEDVVDGEVRGAADEDPLVSRDELADDLDESLSLACEMGKIDRLANATKEGKER